MNIVAALESDPHNSKAKTMFQKIHPILNQTIFLPIVIFDLLGGVAAVGGLGLELPFSNQVFNNGCK